MPRRKKGDDSDSASEGEDYELPADSYYDRKGCAPLDQGGSRGRNRGGPRRNLADEEEKMNKMLEEQSEEAESEAEQPEDEEEEERAAKMKGRATGKDLVPCEVHPLDHVIESTPKKIALAAKSAETKVEGSTEETKDGTNEKPDDQEMKDDNKQEVELKTK